MSVPRLLAGIVVLVWLSFPKSIFYNLQFYVFSEGIPLISPIQILTSCDQANSKLLSHLPHLPHLPNKEQCSDVHLKPSCLVQEICRMFQWKPIYSDWKRASLVQNWKYKLLTYSKYFHFYRIYQISGLLETGNVDLVLKMNTWQTKVDPASRKVKQHGWIFSLFSR